MTSARRFQRRPGAIRVIFIGDVVGKPGRDALAACLPRLLENCQPELVIANVENLAGGKGVSAKTVNELKAMGVDVFTSGNHVWENAESQRVVTEFESVLRPANFPRRNPGRGYGVFLGRTGKKIGVINLIGRVFMDPLQTVTSAFDVVEEALGVIGRETNVSVIDLHAEATSEKQAFGWYVNGRASAMFGTHTHVQTADEKVLPGGTAYITDAGMTGPVDSVIGIRKKDAIEKFLSGLPRRLEVDRTGRKELQGVVVEIDYNNGRAVSIERLQEVEEQ